MNRGVFYGLAAYGTWGLLPIYWKLLQEIPAVEVLAHRAIWSLLFVIGLLLYQQKGNIFRVVIQEPKTLITYFTAGTLVGCNWLIYIWAVNAGYVIETSLGYFITPLVNIVLGLVIFQEQMRVGQWIAVAVAATGVVYLAIVYGSLPWIGLSLAATFGLYGVIKKQAPLDAISGFGLETAALFLPALLYLLWLSWTGTSESIYAAPLIWLVLMGTGLVTALPLIWFAVAAKNIPLSTLGILQYIAPSIQFLLGIFVFGEPFTSVRFLGFLIIWTALVVYTSEGLYTRQQSIKVYRATTQ